MLHRLLSFLNLLDSDGNLSITNIAVIVMVTKIALMTQMTGVDAVALVSTLLNYSHKRIVNANAADPNQ